MRTRTALHTFALSRKKPWHRKMHHLLVKRADGGLEINIHGVIGGWYSPKAADYKAALAEAKELGETEISFSIHSPGGDVVEGFAIKNAMNRCGLATTTRGDGIVASMASILLFSGQRVEISRNALIMIHEPSTYSSGSAKDLRKAAELLDKVTTMLVEEYVKRTGLEEAAIREMMAEETWMTPAEALELGFVDAIVDGEPVEDIDAWATLDWKGVCARVAAEFAPNRPGRPEKDKQDNSTDMKAITALVGLAPTATEAEVVSAVKALQARLDLAENRLEAAAKEEATRKKAEIDAVINEAVKEGRIVEAERAQMELIANASIDALRTVLGRLQPVASLAAGLPTANPVGLGDRSTWNLARWMKEDPEGLKARADSDPAFLDSLPK